MIGIAGRAAMGAASSVFAEIPITSGPITAKSVIFEIANGWGHASYIGMRQVDFLNEGSKITMSDASHTTYGSQYPDGAHYRDNAFRTGTSKVGSRNDNGWQTNTGEVLTQRLVVVFASPITFDKIVICNNHSSGGGTERGVKDMKIYTSTDSITIPTYGLEITNKTFLFDGQVPKHASANTADEQIIVELDEA